MESATLAIFGIIVGIILSDLLKQYLNWFTLSILSVVCFYILYYRSIEKTGQMVKILDHMYGKYNGNITFYDDTKTFYDEAQALLDKAEREILIYNDYFGQDRAVIGFNTSKDYFSKLNKKVKQLSSKDGFRYICMLGVDADIPIEPSDKFRSHLSVLNAMKTTANEEYLKPMQLINDRPFFFSFTIIDAEYLRISLEGIYEGTDGVNSKVVGGFIIKDNEEIVRKFRDEFIAIHRVSSDISTDYATKN